MFFASESDKTPVRRWPTSQVTQLEAEKAKHLSFDINGTPFNINAGSQSTADAIINKLEASRAASAPSPPTSPPITAPARSPSPEPVQAPVLKQKKSVNFAQTAEVITTHEPEEYDESDVEEYSNAIGTILYDFAAEGEDELAVAEGETVTVIDRQGNEDWWKVKNTQGMEGVVPALYVKVCFAFKVPLPYSLPAFFFQLPNEGEPASPTVSSTAQTQARNAQVEAEREAKARAEREQAKKRAEEERQRAEDRARAEEAKRKRIADQHAAEAARVSRETTRKTQEDARVASPPAMPKYVIGRLVF